MTIQSAEIGGQTFHAGDRIRMTPEGHGPQILTISHFFEDDGICASLGDSPYCFTDECVINGDIERVNENGKDAK